MLKYMHMLTMNAERRANVTKISEKSINTLLKSSKCLEDYMCDICGGYIDRYYNWKLKCGCEMSSYMPTVPRTCSIRVKNYICDDRVVNPASSCDFSGAMQQHHQLRLCKDSWL